jgi:hypothetical protein
VSDFDRPTAPRVELIDREIDQPNDGTRCFGLTQGGILVPLIWSHKSRFYEAWMLSPKVPESVKRRMAARLPAIE